MKYDLERLRQWLVKSGYVLCQLPDPPASASVRLYQTAALATLMGEGRRCDVIIKAVSSESRLGDAEQLVRVWKRMRVVSPDFVSHLPRLYGCNHELQCVVTEFVPGNLLSSQLWSELRTRRDSEASLPHLKACAQLLARCHETRPQDVGVSATSRSIGSFAVAAKGIVERTCTRGPLRAVGRQLISWIDGIPRDLNRMICSRVMLDDCQPKNVLIRENGTLTCIDVDFDVGPGALNAGMFAAAFERMQLRTMSQATRDRIMVWREAFCDTYMQVADHECARSFPFFYIWALLCTLESQLSKHWFLRGYIARRYAETFDFALRFANRSCQNPKAGYITNP